MFISVLELFKIGVGPSSSHTMGPMVAARDFASRMTAFAGRVPLSPGLRVRCMLRGSLAFTGKGHATDRAVVLGLHGYAPQDVAAQDVDDLIARLWQQHSIDLGGGHSACFHPEDDVVFDRGEPLPEHPNGMIFELCAAAGDVLLSETYFSIGGGFISTLEEISRLVAPMSMSPAFSCPYPFDSARSMLQMSADSGLSIAAMKRTGQEMSHKYKETALGGLAVSITEC